MPDYTLHLGDCLEYMRGLPDGCFDAVVTDPPYGVNIADWDADIPSNATLEECMRVSAGMVIWFASAARMLDLALYIPRPDRILIWAPKFTLLKIAKDGYAYRYHPIALWRTRTQTAIPWDVMNDMTEGHRWWYHPGTKPLSLMRKLINAARGATIFDPFMGSGTTGVACMQLGRRFVGCEIDPDYFAIAEKRISEAAKQPPLFTDEPKKEGPTQGGLFDA